MKGMAICHTLICSLTAHRVGSGWPKLTLRGLTPPEENKIISILGGFVSWNS